MVALADTIRRFAIPPQPFLDLLTAFEQDQRVTRYDTFDQLLGYCRNSANPVGRLVLHLFGCHDEERGRLADEVCTGLQLANFWQDVARDFDQGRVYLPREDLVRFGVTPRVVTNETLRGAPPLPGGERSARARHEAGEGSSCEGPLTRHRRSAPDGDLSPARRGGGDREGYDETDLAAKRFTPAFAELMRFQVARTRGFFDRGRALLSLVPKRVRIDVDLFIRGGEAVLDAIERRRYDVLTRRPAVSKTKQLLLLGRAVLRTLVG